MKPKVTVYMSAEELAQLKKAAARRRLSVSRYAKERLVPSGTETIVESEGAIAEAGERRLIDQLRKAIAARHDGLAENLRTVMVMLDQLVRSTLTHLPEIPAAQHKECMAAGERRHRDWQHQVELLLRQLRGEPDEEKPAAAASVVQA